MIIFSILAIVLLTLEIGAFFKILPQNANSKLLRAYNLISCLIIFLLASYFGYRQYSIFSNTVDYAWAPILGAISFISSFIIGLLIAFIIRNYLVFRR